MDMEKEVATEKADKLEAEAAEYQKTSAKFENVNKIKNIKNYDPKFRKVLMFSSTTPSRAQRTPPKSSKSQIRRYFTNINFRCLTPGGRN